MKIAYNPSGASPLAGAPKNNNDIIFDLAGKAIYVKDVKLLGTDTVYDVFKKHTSSNGGGNVGLVPVPSYTNTNTRFLREDGTWVVPTNTTYEVFTGSNLENSGKAGLVPAPLAGFQKLLQSDGTWTLKFLFYDIPANSAIKITFYSQTHATLFIRHTYGNNMGVYYISGYGSYGDTKRISIVEVINSCSGIIYPVDGEFAVIIKNPETTNRLFVSATLLLGSIRKIETVTSEVTKSDIWRNVLHSDNAFIKNGTININGVSITPLTQHQSLSNYVTLDTALVITGYKDFTRQVKISTAGNPLKLTSSTTYCDISFNITNSDGTTVGSGIVLRGDANFVIHDDGWHNEYQILHSNNYTKYKHAYTNLTGSGITANLAIVSTGTANGWTLKTLGSNAFDSTAYLPLSGGTLTGALTIKCTTDAKLILDNIDSETNFLYIDFRQNNTSCGTLGITTMGGTNLQWSGKTLLHTGNYSTILDGRYYTESEIDTKLGNYVTIDTTLTITGSKIFNNTVNINTNTNTTPLKISRLGSDAEYLSIGLDDTTTHFHYKNDELGANFKFTGEWDNTGDNGTGDSPGNNFVLFKFSKDTTKILLNDGTSTYTVLHSGIAYIEKGKITINGISITPLTSHLSLANYVTLNSSQTISGAKTFTQALVTNSYVEGTKLRFITNSSSQGNYLYILNSSCYTAQSSPTTHDFIVKTGLPISANRKYYLELKGDLYSGGNTFNLIISFFMYNSNIHEFRVAGFTTYPTSTHIATYIENNIEKIAIYVENGTSHNILQHFITLNLYKHSKDDPDFTIINATTSDINSLTIKSSINNTSNLYLGNINTSKIKLIGGTSSQFLKGDGSVDSNTYATTTLLGLYLPLTGGTLTGDLNFGHLNSVVKGHITWTGGTILQRIQISDNNSTNDAVFAFLLSTNSGTDWTDLFTIRDNGYVIATSFIGNLDWSYITNKPTSFTPSAHTHTTKQITACTDYAMASQRGNVSTEDSLNIALGKIEYKALLGVTAYDLVKAATDDDGTIENLNEILKVLLGISDTDTIQGIMNKYLPLAGGTMTGILQLTVDTAYISSRGLALLAHSNSTNFTGVSKGVDTTVVGNTSYATLIRSNDTNLVHYKNNASYNILDASNTFINNGVITINGTSITPLTLHLSLANYVTLDTYLKITGLKLFNTSTNTLPLLIARGGNGESEVLKIGIDDQNATFEYINDEISNSFLFKLVNTDIENGGEGINANSSLVKFYGDADGSVVIANKFMGQLDKTLTFAAGAFTAKTYNNSSAVTVNVPTKTSHLTNDSGYLTSRGFIGTTAVQASSAAQALTGITSATISGVTSTNTLTISNTSGTGHINFSRGSCNYITMPSGGLLHILPNGVGVSASNGMVFSYNGLHPATNSAYSLGTSSLRWNLVYAHELVSASCQSNFIALNSSGRLSNYGGYIDFHFHNSDGKPTDNLGNVVETTPDYTSRIIENAAGTLSINGATFKNGYVTSTGFVKSGSSDSYILLGGGNHKAVSDFLLKSELENLELNSNTTTIEKSLQVTKDWMDTGIKSTDIPANGSYIVQVYLHASDDNFYSCYWTGLMSWYSSAVNDTESDEILLHRAGHAYNNTIYLRTKMTGSINYGGTGEGLKLLIAANKDLSAAYTFKFKFKQVI